jgi:hypothetical protein
MIQRGCRARFMAKTIAKIRISSSFLRNKFERDSTV